MSAACQGFYGVFGTLSLSCAAAIGILATSLASTTAPSALSVDVARWRARPFSEVVLDHPELAACHLLAPGSWAAAREPASLAEPARLAGALTMQLEGALTSRDALHLDVIVADNQADTFSASAAGTTVLLLVPATVPWKDDDAARVVVTALARGRSSLVPPDPRCSEPLLALAEAIAMAGSFTLATLPPELRPVADWLEADDAEAPLAELVAAALDRDEPWSTRRVRLQQTALTSGANARLLNAAALLVEAYGDAAAARREPYDLLLAWRSNRGKKFPSAPGALRRALAAPLTAGMPAKSSADDAAAIIRDALERVVESGRLEAIPSLQGAPLRLRALAAARARAAGADQACRWLLAGPVPEGIRSGCRPEETVTGYVASRPRPQGGFEVFATAGAEEIVLLHWPRWLLHPLVDGRRMQLVFADREGIWGVALDGSTPPRLLASGAFRHLALSPDGAHLAAARWPEGTLALLTLPTGVKSIQADAYGGVAWLDAEVMVAAGRTDAVVASVGGDVRPFPLDTSCACSLTRSGAALLLATRAPCEPGLAWVPLGEGERRQVVTRTDGPLGVLPLPGGGVAFGDLDGVFRWSGGDAVPRIGGGLTPGPG